MRLYRPIWRNRTQQRGACVSLCRTVLILTLFLAIPVLSYARGQQGDVLSRVDELITQKRYTEALSILVPYMKDNPKNFEAAQKRVQQILFIKEEYNRIAQGLLDEMEKEEPDNEKILTLTNQLYELDPERIAETQDFINKTRELALFRSNMRRLDRILTQGQELVNQSRYAEALRTYTEGFTIYQTEFFSGQYGQAMENRARQELNGINSNIAGVTSAVNALQEAVNALETLSSQGIESQNLVTYRNAYNRLGSEMDRFTTLRNTFANTDTAFKEDLSLLRRNFPQQGDRNFLAFAVRIMEGRGDLGGMLNVFDTIWYKAIPQARELLDQKTRMVFTAIVNDASAREYGRIAARSDILAAYGSFPEDLEERWGRYHLAQKETIFDRSVPAEEAGFYLKFRYLAESSALWRTLGQLGSRYIAVPNQDSINLWRNGVNGDELIRAESNSITILRQIRTDTRTLLNTIQQGSARYRNIETRIPDSGYQIYLEGINSSTEDLLKLIGDQEETSSFRRYTIANGLIDNRIKAREKEFTDSTVLFEGTRRDDYLAKFPTRAAELLTQMDRSMEADRQSLQTLLGEYNADITGSSRVKVLQEEATAMLSRLDNTRSQGRNMATLARSQSTDAANLRRDGDRFYAEAQSALARGDFTTAQTRVQRAAEAYDQSLEREYDENTWAMRNTSVHDLDERISEAYNQDVIRQVRELVDQIQVSYYGNDFDQAERLISRAQNIWKLTQAQDHPDLVYWNNMIVAGIRSGRTIPPTAPLYAEMSQLLSDARKNYEEGRTLILTSTSEGRRRLNSAKQDLEKVKLVYPMNEDAGILDLMIDRELDPNFAATLNAKIQGAIQITRTGSPGARIQAVNDLRNYRTVFRDFLPNWEAIIFQAEVDAGLRPRPPSPEEIAEAAAIVARSRSIIAGNNLDAIIGARDELSRARRIDPNNRDAGPLFDEASRKIRIIGTVLLPEAERLYQQAAQALTQDNAIRARQLLNQIYSLNPDYRYIGKVVTLHQRVESRL
ncbi:MAG: hypothetical protein FWG07_02530 [Treponema sp.]|nr:hypothetical protein [Treponema sp.]